MNPAKDLAQQLFNKAVSTLTNNTSSLPEDIVKSLGIQFAQIMLDNIYDRNTDPSKNDFYCRVNEFINEELVFEK